MVRLFPQRLICNSMTPTLPLWSTARESTRARFLLGLKRRILYITLYEGIATLASGAVAPA